ncbi:MAG: ABC transporter permease [Solirubrobacteraceae bacterium]|nr:ABC transporter permease [Solirubrobacteraceae bacterium]
MSSLRAIVRIELRVLRHDPVPLVLLIGMPIVLMVLLSQSLGRVLLFEGYDDAPGSMHTAPGMACLFGFFSVAIVGFAIFREHGWRTWPRLRAAGVGGRALLAGKLAVPAGLLVLQHIVLFGFGVVFLDFKVNGEWLAVALLASAFALMILAAGLAAAAVLSTVQQLNAVTNLGTMLLGGLGGALVPVMELPKWVQPISPASPVNWAMQGYRDVILDGAGVGDVVLRLAAMCGLALALVAVALWRLRADTPKRTWG